MPSSQPPTERMLPDFNALVERKTKEMTRVKLLALYEERMQQIKVEEEAAAALADKGRGAASSLFVEPDDEGAVPVGVSSHVSKPTNFSSSQKGGDDNVVKGFMQEPENPVTKAKPCATEVVSPPSSTNHIPRAPTSIPTASRQTVVTTGPYAGLLSAGKRPRDNAANPFAPPRKQHRQSDGHVSSQNINNRAPVNRGNLQTLRYFHTLIEQTPKVKPQDLDQHFAKMRGNLHQLEFYDFLSHNRNAENLIDQSWLLENDALPAISEDKIPGLRLPVDIRLDCQALYRKWSSGNYDPHLLRGIKTKQGSNKDGRNFRHHVLDKDYEFTVRCSYFGSGQLVIGQWWPLQICAVRDGAHGEMEGGIHGKPDEGAYSVVVSGAGYANIDRGNNIEYCGTPGSKDAPSANTKHLIKSCELGRQVRVLRSAQLPADNPYRPTHGIRYDGLYEVYGWDVLDVNTAMYRFKLTRVAQQPAIRCKGPGIRPTEVEIRQYNAVKGLFGR